MLKESFIGNGRTVMIANISPSSYSCLETVNTLRYLATTHLRTHAPTHPPTKAPTNLFDHSFSQSVMAATE